MKKYLMPITVGLIAASALILGVAVRFPAVAADLPADAREKIGDADLAEIYCLNAKWKQTEFLAMLDAAQDILPPVMARVAELGVTIKYPDLTALKTDSLAKLGTVCDTDTLAAAQAATADFQAWGQTVQGEFDLVKGDIESGLAAKGEELKKRVKAGETPAVRSELDRFAAVAREVRSLGADINSRAADRLLAHADDRNRAAAKRREAVVRYVDFSIAAAKAELDSHNAELDVYKAANPGAMTSDEIIKAMTTDRGMLDAAIGQATATGDEAAFSAAIGGFRRNWDGYRNQVSKAMMNPAPFCDLVRTRIDQASPKLDEWVRRSDDLVSGCVGRNDTMCRKAAELGGRLSEMKVMVLGIENDMRRVREMCQTAGVDGAVSQELFTVLDGIRQKGSAVRQMDAAVARLKR